MNEQLFNTLLTLITFIITIGGGYLINFLRQKIDNENLTKYYKLTKQVVMSIEQSSPQLSGIDKKELAVSKLLKITNNKISPQQADILIESAVYDIKKLLSSTK